MKAYGHSTDANSGFLQEGGRSHSHETDSPFVVHEEYGWHQPPQFSVEFKPHVQGQSQSLPPAKDFPAERWLRPRKTG